jgi:D-alanyl-D-alanine carboxypeptidase
MRRSSPTLITLLVALALIAVPVAAHALGTTGRAGSGDAVDDGAAVLLAPQSESALAQLARKVRERERAAAVASAAALDADVLVDKRRGLGPRYRPRDLVVPRVAFLAGTSAEGHRLRRRPARALEGMFAAARRDGVRLAGVSGFRSFASQRALFAGYARERGAEDAAHVSARAGHSEHQTGLAIDISGADGRCAATACFAGSRPARWLAAHAARFGFVVRYPRGEEEVTGYDFEPWHLRFVGRALAREALASGETLDRLLAEPGSPVRQAIP